MTYNDYTERFTYVEVPGDEETENVIVHAWTAEASGDDGVSATIGYPLASGAVKDVTDILMDFLPASWGKKAAKIGSSAAKTGTKMAIGMAAKKTGKSLKKLDQNFLKKLGINPEAFKKGFVGNKGGRYNIHRDTKTGEIFLVPVKGKGKVIPTGEYLK